MSSFIRVVSKLGRTLLSPRHTRMVILKIAVSCLRLGGVHWYGFNKTGTPWLEVID
jgi:hypothetical protein